MQLIPLLYPQWVKKKYWTDACIRVMLIRCAIKNDNLISAQGKTIAPRV